MVVLEIPDFFIVFTVGIRCGSLERSDFLTVYNWEGVVVLERTDF